jgi:hypothetical protein
MQESLCESLRRTGSEAKERNLKIVCARSCALNWLLLESQQQLERETERGLLTCVIVIASLVVPARICIRVCYVNTVSSSTATQRYQVHHMLFRIKEVTINTAIAATAAASAITLS